jgi:hypothetical protein
MGRGMSIAARKRTRDLGLVLVLGALVWSAILGAGTRLLPVEYLSGWLLVSLTGLLWLFGARKRITTLPLGPARMWMRTHIVIGLLCGFVFLGHLDFELPTGGYEIVLALLFVVLFATGVLGLVLERWLAQRLASCGTTTIFERIPVLTRSIHDELFEAFRAGARRDDATAAPALFVERFAEYFRAPRHFWAHMFGSERPLQRMHAEVASVRRFSSADEGVLLDMLLERIELKYRLDCQHALQWAMKSWLFVHVPVAFVLLPLVALHIVLVHVF